MLESKEVELKIVRKIAEHKLTLHSFYLRIGSLVRWTKAMSLESVFAGVEATIEAPLPKSFSKLVEWEQFLKKASEDLVKLYFHLKKPLLDANGKFTIFDDPKHIGTYDRKQAQALRDSAKFYLLSSYFD